MALIVMLSKYLTLNKVKYSIKNKMGAWDMAQGLKKLVTHSWGWEIRYKAMQGTANSQCL